MAVNETATAGVITLATILTAQPFGLPVETIAIGTGFAFVGVIGKAAFEAQRAIESGKSVNLGPILGWVGSGMIGAPFVTIVYLVLLKMLGVPADNMAILGLIFCGFLGPKAVTSLVNWGTDFLKSKTGVSINDDAKDGKAP